MKSREEKRVQKLKKKKMNEIKNIYLGSFNFCATLIFARLKSAQISENITLGWGPILSLEMALVGSRSSN